MAPRVFFFQKLMYWCLHVTGLLTPKKHSLTANIIIVKAWMGHSMPVEHIDLLLEIMY